LIDWLIVVYCQVNTSSAIFVTRTSLPTINHVGNTIYRCQWDVSVDRWLALQKVEINKVRKCSIATRPATTTSNIFA
jgi:hypothetical protein